MPFDPIYDRFGILGLFVFLSLSGMVLYLTLSGSSYWFFYVRGRQKYVPDFEPKADEIKKMLRWGTYSIVGNAALMLPFEYGVIKGSSKIYVSVSDYGWPYLIFSIIALTVITDACIYWVHRALHHPLLFRRIHAPHPQCRSPNPWASVAFHPLDSFGQALPYHVCAFLFPLHIWVYMGGITFVTLWAVMIHDRITFVSSRFVNNTGCHTVHHWYNRYNLGQYFSFMDRIFGTYKSPASLPDQFFSSKWRDLPKNDAPNNASVTETA